MTLASESIKEDLSDQPVGASRRWPSLILALTIVAALAELLGGLGYRLGWWSFGIGIQTIRWAASAAAALLVVALIALIWGQFNKKTAQRGTLISVVLLGLMTLISPALHFYKMQNLPRIHDISTDSKNPPPFEAVLGQRKDAKTFSQYDASDAAQQAQAYPDIKSLRVSAPPAGALQRAEAIAKELGWELVKVSASELRLEATSTSLLFGFKDDIVVRISPAEGGSLIDVRSKSRVGRHDFGVNATRIRAFLQEMASAP
jgi:uncharacterized protein (DUF1499 family)